MTDPKTTLVQVNPHAILLEGHDDALIGIVWLPGQVRPVAMYDDTLLIESIITRNPNWSAEEAYDWIDAIPDTNDAPIIVEVLADAEELDESIDWS